MADSEQQQAIKLDTTVPQTARIWNYWLGGKDNFAVDRQVGDQIREAFPQIVENARASRAFLVRSVSYVTSEGGIRQFLDVGTGLPTADNTHQIAQRLVPEARIVYVDADGRDSAKVLAAAGKTLDLTQPVTLIMSGILGHVTDEDEAQRMVREYLAALPSGSYFIALDGSHSEEHSEAERIWNEQANPPYLLRDKEQFSRFFEGLEMVEPGVVSAPLWRPTADSPTPLDVLCGVGRKP